MPSTIRDLTELTAVAVDDYFLVSDTSDVVNRDKRISQANLLSSAALRSGTPVLNRLATWLNATTVQDSGILVTDMARLSVNNNFASVNQVPAINTIVQTISTDNVFSFTVLGASGMVLVCCNNDSTVGLVALFRAGSSPYCVSLVAGTNSNVTTGVLTGTTGATGKLTVSAFSDGKIYMENRRGTPLVFRALIVGG